MNNKLKIVLVIVIIGAVIGYCKWNKPHKDVKDATAIKVTAEELYNSFLKDSLTAKTRYINNIIEVKGVIAQESKNKQGQQVVLLNTETPNAYINCTMEDPVNNIELDHIISVKGICNGLNSGDVDLGIPGDVILVRGYATN